MKGPNMFESFWGITTIGEKGQAVIPAEARKKMNLEKGEKLLVLSFDDDILILSKVKGLETFASHLSKQLEDVKSIINKNKK
jgi:AbrB family looped-hinge helix DNA binding protein